MSFPSSSRVPGTQKDKSAMSRYLFPVLTPHKVVLLVLIHIYCSGWIPPKFNATFFKVLLQHIGKPKTQDPPLDDFRRELSNISVTRLYQNVYEVLLDMVWSLESFDQFHTFIMMTDDYVVSRQSPKEEWRVTRPLLSSSMLGRYVRRCRIEYIKLDFEDAGLLWTVFKQHRMQAVNDITSERAAELFDSFGEMFTTHYNPSKPANFVSMAKRDIESLLKRESEEFGKYKPQSIFASRKLLMVDFIGSSITTPDTHLLKAQDAIDSGDYSKAVGHIHSCFDNVTATENRFGELPTTYQTALFNLATLHEQFENYSEAILASNEAIVSARELKDESQCLSCLAWFGQFSKKLASRRGIILPHEQSSQYMKMNAKEPHLPGLLAALNFLDVRSLLFNGGSLIPVFEHLLRASHLNIGLSEETLPQLAFKCTLWSRLGVQHLSSLYVETALQLNLPDTLEDRVVRAQCLKAQILFRQGRISEAFELLDALSSAPEAQPFLWQNMVQFYRTLIELNLCVNRQNVDDANVKLVRLKALHYTEDTAATSLAVSESLVQLLRGNGEQALQIVRERFKTLNEREGDVAERLYIMFLHGQILVKLGKPTKALSLLLRCANLAEKHYCRFVYLQAVSLLANVMNQIAQYTEGYEVLTAVMPYVIETEDCDLMAFSYLTLAESLLGMVDDDTTQSNLKQAHIYLLNARTGFEAIEHRQNQLKCLAKLAFVHDKLGDVSARDEAARQFFDLNV